MSEQKLIEKLKLIETLYAGTDVEGEKEAAEFAAERIRKKLAEIQKVEKDLEYRFSTGDYWSKKLLLALLRRYNLEPYSYYRQKFTTVMVKAPKKFVEEILNPEYNKLDKVLSEYLEDVTNKVISENIFADLSEEKKREECRLLQ